MTDKPPQDPPPWTQSTLERTNRLLASIADTTNLLMACLDSDFNFLWTNRAYAEAAGREPDFFIGKNHFDLYPHEENEAIFQEVVRTGEPFSIEAKPFEHPDQPERGTTYWHWRLVPVKGRDGEVERLLLTLLDVTESEKAKRELRDSEAQLSAIFEGAPFVMMVLDGEGRVTRINRTGVRLAGRPQEELTGLRGGEAMRCVQALTNPEGCGAGPTCRECPVRKTVLDTVETGQSHRQVQADMTFDRNGETQERTFLVYSTPLEVSGEPRALAVFEDVTERERARRELKALTNELEQRVAERTAELRRRSAELEQLAHELTRAEERERRRIAGILHEDLQQMLAYAKLRVANLAGRDDASAEQARTVQDVIEALSDVIETSRTLSQELSPSLLHTRGLGAALQQLARIMGRKHGLKVDADLPVHNLDLAEEVRVFGYHAVAELLFNVTKHAATDRVHLMARDSEGQVRIVVEDDGVGFDPEQVRKAAGEEAGFGLFNIEHRAELVGGSLTVNSAPGEGSRFVLTLPTTGG